MIRNQWYAVLESKEVKRGVLTGAVRLGEKLVFWRDAVTEEVFCIADKCAHRGASLSRGKILSGRVQCPFHGLEFDGAGRCRLIPANGRNTEVPKQFQVNSYTVREAHDFIWIFWGSRTGSLPQLPWFDDIDDTMPYISMRDPWAVHYSRCIENQLDVVHLPFVHYDTIGRGGQTLVNGPLVVEEGSDFFIYVYNALDEGHKPLKPEEIPPPAGKRQYLHFRFPNLWQNYILERMRIVISFVPVDEENSLVYMRYYQSFIRVPLLKGLVNKLGMLFSIKILHQDRRVVETQLPKKTSYRMNENLIQGDLPIIKYRQLRENLLEGVRPE